MNVPSLLNSTAQIAVPGAVAVMMFCLGMGLDRAAFARIVRRPRLMAISLLCQLLLTPIIALLMVRMLKLEPTLAGGLVLVSACPVTAAATLLTRLARGNVALSVALTAVTSLAAAVTIPPFMAMVGYAGAHGEFSGVAALLRLGLSLAALAALPVLIGMGVRAASPRTATRVEPWAVRIASAAFGFGLIAAVAAAWSQIPFSMVQAGVLSLVLAALVLGLAYVVTIVTGLPPADRTAIVLGTLTRKFTMASFVALTICNDARLLLPGIAYCLLMWIPAASLVWWARRTEVASEATRQATREPDTPVATAGV